MKRYYVTVNGTRYEVEVEEVKGDFSPRIAAAPTVSYEPEEEVKQEPVKRPVETVATAQEEPKNATQPQNISNVDGEVIECPMPGTILKVNVSEGTVVKKGDVLFILEAMKMENEIMAARDGIIAKVGVNKGAVVNTGDTLAVIQ